MSSKPANPVKNVISMPTCANLTTWTLHGASRCGARLYTPDPSGEPLPPVRGGEAPTILYFNDSHGGLGRILPAVEATVRDCREKGCDWLVLSGGDDHGGGSVEDASLDEEPSWSKAFTLMEAAGVDLAVPGNHDLEGGWERFHACARKTPGILRVLSHGREEVYMPGTLYPAAVIDTGNHLLGILGALSIDQTREATRYLLPVDPHLNDLSEGLRPQVDSLVILSHLGYASPREPCPDQRLLEILDEAVLVLGSHSHDVMPEAGAAVPGRYLQSGQKGAFLGRATPTGKGLWQLVNTPVPERQPGPALLGERLPFLGNLPPVPPGEPVPNKQGYLGETPALNGVTDALHAHLGLGPEDLMAVCVRLLSNIFPQEVRSREDWYRAFPYGDALAVIAFPEEALPALLEANARRLLLPPVYREDRGMLHFDKSLRYAVELTDKHVHLRAIHRHGKLLGASPAAGRTLRLWTQGYVAEGMGGYDAVFAEAGIDWSREQVAYKGGAIRQLFWKALETADADQAASLFRRDGRLKVIRR